MDLRHVFGPVASGRLGRSLGLDLLGRRVCSMDCIYCEVGATELLTLERRAWVEPEAVLAELSAWAGQGHPRPDHVTLGGLGEPCLNTGLGRVLRGCRDILPGAPVAVLTNSTLLGDRQVREELCAADVVLPSLDSLVEREFRRVNRPLPGIGPAEVAAGLLEFRAGYRGKIFLEVLLVRGYNDSDENLERLELFCRELRPERVDVVTLSRPGTLAGAQAVDKEVLARWRSALSAAVPGPRTPAAGPTRGALQSAGLRERLLASLRRRPQTAADLSWALGASEEAVRAVLDQMGREGTLRVREIEGRAFASLRDDADA